MRTFTSNLIILSAIIGDTISGTAISDDIKVNFAAAATDVNKRLFVPEAQLVCTGKFRVSKEIATIGAWISTVLVAVSIPEPAEIVTETIETVPVEIVVAEIETPVGEAATTEIVEPLPVEAPTLTPAQKAATTRAANKAKATAAATPIEGDLVPC